MIAPFAKDDALLADITAHRGTQGLRLWWLGQSGFLLHHAGRFLLIDPYLSESLSLKYEATDKPHTRLTELVIDPARLDMIDIVTSSHNHTDHLDAATLLPLRAANPGLQFVIPEANRAFVAERLGCDPAWPHGLNDGAALDFGSWHIRAVASAHEHLDPTPAGLYPYLGYVIRTGRYTIYHPGDTVLYEGLAEKLKPLQIDVALLPINGTLPQRRVTGNLWGREAAWLAKEIGAGLAIPCHFDMFEFNTESPAEFIAHCEALTQPHGILRNGEGITLP
ncbi:MAG: MBL fold metallo-hydrolase [Bryobacterales bacterium]|nr:MBL fold metallo-hydrolase [Bryobacterales bacterium]